MVSQIFGQSLVVVLLLRLLYVVGDGDDCYDEYDDCGDHEYDRHDVGGANYYLMMRVSRVEAAAVRLP